MIRYLAIVFLAAYSLAMVKPLLPYVDYVINQDYIAEVLCINKDKPQLKCNGQCHLKAQIEKQVEEENQPEAPPAPTSETQHLPLFFETFGGLIPDPVSESSLAYFDYQEALLAAPDFDIFHPPQAS